MTIRHGSLVATIIACLVLLAGCTGARNTSRNSSVAATRPVPTHSSSTVEVYPNWTAELVAARDDIVIRSRLDNWAKTILIEYDPTDHALFRCYFDSSAQPRIVITAGLLDAVWNISVAHAIGSHVWPRQDWTTKYLLVQRRNYPTLVDPCKLSGLSFADLPDPVRRSAFARFRNCVRFFVAHELGHVKLKHEPRHPDEPLSSFWERSAVLETDADAFALSLIAEQPEIVLAASQLFTDLVLVIPSRFSTATEESAYPPDFERGLQFASRGMTLRKDDRADRAITSSLLALLNRCQQYKDNPSMLASLDVLSSDMSVESLYCNSADREERRYAALAEVVRMSEAHVEDRKVVDAIRYIESRADLGNGLAKEAIRDFYDHHDLRAVLEWLILEEATWGVQDRETTLEQACNVAWILGDYVRCERLSRRLGKLRPAASGPLLAQGLAIGFQGRHRDAKIVLQRCVELAIETLDRRIEAQAEHALGSIAFVENDVETASRYLASAADLFADLGELFGEAACRTQLGVIRLSEGSDAAAVVELTRARECQNYSILAGTDELLWQVQNVLGLALLAGGRRAEARTELEAAVLVAKRVGWKDREAISTANVGLVAYREGNLADAHQKWDAALKLLPDGETDTRQQIEDMARVARQQKGPP